MISVVVPIYNEQANIESLLVRLTAALGQLQRPYEIVLVDDGSRDNSLLMLKAAAHLDSHLTVVELTRNYGQHAAIFAGFSQVRGEIIITIDADLQNPPEEIPRLIACMEVGDYDLVGTVRKERKDSPLRKLPSKIVNAMARKITGVRMSDWGCMLRAYRRVVVDHMLRCREHGTFIPALATYFSKNFTEIEVEHFARQGGESKYGLFSLIRLQFDLVASFSELPMRILMYGGIFMSLMGISFGVFLAVLRLAYGVKWAAQGVFTMFAVLFVFVGLQFFAMGIIGEYIGRIYREVRKRPEYVIHRIIRKAE
ncbi:MAG: glycosyltransferase [Deltaproteobacteria bacterium]|nr:glycosyltransferase [Deltaproteobacteria bacterium]